MALQRTLVGAGGPVKRRVGGRGGGLLREGAAREPGRSGPMDGVPRPPARARPAVPSEA